MSTAVDAFNPSTTSDRVDDEFDQIAKGRLRAYWRKFGLVDSAHIEALTDECLQRAKRRVGPGQHEELVRRALEEAQRRYDHATAIALGMNAANDVPKVAAARAAILLGWPGEFRADDLLFPPDDVADAAAKLTRVLPQPTPPEAQLTMTEQSLSFVFGPPTTHSH